MANEAQLKEGDGGGLVPDGEGWFVLNARDARWFHRPGRDSLPLTGCDEFEAETYFPMLGMSLQVLSPGEPNSMYHWETEQEDFLVLAGEALLIVEEQERPLKRWDFVHCPPETRHVFVGAGDGPWGYYTIDEAAQRHGACPEVETQDSEAAYVHLPPRQPSRYREGLLPD